MNKLFYFINSKGTQKIIIIKKIHLFHPMALKGKICSGSNETFDINIRCACRFVIRGAFRLGHDKLKPRISHSFTCLPPLRCNLTLWQGVKRMGPGWPLLTSSKYDQSSFISVVSYLLIFNSLRCFFSILFPRHKFRNFFFC